MDNSVVVKSVIREMEHAFHLTRKLQSLIELGSYSDSLKDSAKILSEEVLKTCNATLSALKSPPETNNIIPKQKRKRGGDHQARRDLRQSFSRKQVTAAPYDDGHRWRKYGEKKINGCFFKRSYYRCTYHDEQRCAARKQVQQDDKDPTLFLVIYKGEHTCNSMSAAEDVQRMVQCKGMTPPDHEPFLLRFDAKPGEEDQDDGKCTCMIIPSRTSDGNSLSKVEADEVVTFLKWEEALGSISSSGICGVDDDDRTVFDGIFSPCSSGLFEMDLLGFGFEGMESFATMR
ncbi:putative WRKY transcription factor 14 isoform X2 [Canna indica]|uniref:WRKY transcription factor 14 isoform X2 n=1 Tax=Canna indica TaxID=4628 RepID=A0AAQ3Q212_9LILI|nr:putative WRKY transcription factor 14 isoform X2 [Canna indica]